MHKGGESRNGVPVVVSRGAHSVRYRILSDRMEASEDQEDLISEDHKKIEGIRPLL